MPVRPAADYTGQQRGVGAEEELRPHRAHRADTEPGELTDFLVNIPRKGTGGNQFI